MKKLAPFLLTAILVASIMLMIINIRVVEAGTITVPDDYSTIQEAINAAYDGDTVFVSSGTYYENIVVNKTISLLGENWETTIIDGSSSGTVVVCSEVSEARICNFTIQNGEIGIGLYQTTNITISQSVIQNARLPGILFMDENRYAVIKGNKIANNGRGLSATGYVIDCMFAENNITGNSWGGLNGEDGFWLENSIIGNNIMYNQYFGVSLVDYHGMGRGNSIVGNNITNNEEGISFYYPCENNTISGNNVSANTGWGISLSNGPSNNTISGNTITDNGNGVLMSSGWVTCSNNSVVGNNIEANGGHGILLQDATDNSLSGNKITNNLYGVSLSALGWSETGSERNLICENNIVGNSIYGIEVLNSSNNLIYHNNLQSNTAQVLSQNSSNIWDDGYPSGGNYWSDYAGGADLYRGPAQDENGSDGIVDLPYTINAGNRDNYPLMRPRASTRIVPDDYPTIQAAIDAAINGDIVFVRNGTYYENLVLSKNLTLTGENKEATIIDGSAHLLGQDAVIAIENYGQGCEIAGFTIRNCSTGVSMWIAEGVVIENSNIMDCTVAVSASHSSFVVTASSITNNTVGISISRGGGSIINNTFADNRNAISIGTQGGGTISDNLIVRSSNSGIILTDEASGSNIIHNFIWKNKYAIICTGMGVTITNNTLIQNEWGLWTENLDPYHPSFYHNNFIHNDKQVHVTGGQALWDDGYPSGGNYWSDYNGTDFYSGQYQNITGSDGFGDTPYVIDPYQQDNYPFSEPLALQLPQLPSPFPPAARFLYEPTYPVVNGTITFDASVSDDVDGNIVSYQWDFGDEASLTDTQSLVTHFYKSVGNYTVVLTVTDNEGFNGTCTKIVSVGRMSSEISVMADPSPITIRGETTISGAVNPNRPGANVTIWYEPPDALTWDILANVTTEPSSNYSYSWLPSKTGAYKLKATWSGDEYTFENESAPIDFECLNISSSISISTSCASTYLGFKVNITGTLEDMYGNSLTNKTVVLYYTFRGITTWTPITSDETDSFGNYFVVWIPPATGDFVVKAEWTGNATHSEVDNATTLSTVLYNYEYVFSVESNSTVSSLAYDSQNQILSFRVIGPLFSEGYTRVTIAKTLVSNITDLKIHFDGIECEYVAEDLGESWVLTFTYAHSTHQVEIVLNPTAIPEFSTLLLLTLTLITTLLATIVYRRAVNRRANC